MKLSGAEILMETLIEQGVDVVFGYPGGQVINIFDALGHKSDKIRHVLSAHEQGAIHAAEGYARASQKTGVVIATSGPGATNLVTGIADAFLDSIPIVAITGNVPIHLLGKDSFQEVDIVGVTVPITKHNFLVKDVTQLAETIKKAFIIANSGRPGPVLIDIPKDIQMARCEYTGIGHFEKREAPAIDKKSIDKAVEAINKSNRPMIYFGGGIKSSNAKKELIAFSEKLDSPMAATIMGLSVVAHDHPNYLGMLGMHGRMVSNKAIDECDLLIVIGARFSDRITGDKTKFASKANIIHIEMDISEIDKNITSHYSIRGDAREALEMLTEKIDKKDNSLWKNYLRDYEKANITEDTPAGNGIDPIKVLKQVNETTKHKAQVVTDVGQHQVLVAQQYEFSDDSIFVSSCGLGTMGFGMGAANGVQIAKPDSPVVLFTGDGSFHMNLNELAVAVTENLPIVVLIYNNAVLGMVRQWQNLFFDKHYSGTTPNRKTDFVKLAEAFGATGMRIEKDSQIKEVINKAFEIDGPVVIDCIIDPDYNVFPFIPAGKAFEDTIIAPGS